MKTLYGILFALVLFVIAATVVPVAAFTVWGYVCAFSSCFICSALLWRFR